MGTMLSYDCGYPVLLASEFECMLCFGRESGLSDGLLLLECRYMYVIIVHVIIIIIICSFV